MIKLINIVTLSQKDVAILLPQREETFTKSNEFVSLQRKNKEYVKAMY